MKIGYARVSTIDQNTQMQVDALEDIGCEKIFTDKVSGNHKERIGLQKAKEILRPGDEFIVWRLDRLGRSLKDLIEWISYFEENDITFKSLQEELNTSNSTGKLIFHLFGALAEFERNLISERTKAGLKAAKARGRKGGRPKKLASMKRDLVKDLYNAKKHTVMEICEMMDISKPTLYQYVRQ